MDNNVFKRTIAEGPLISQRLYNLVIGAVLAWGFLINYFIVKAVQVRFTSMTQFWLFFIGYFASCMLGMSIIRRSNNPAISFLGYNFIVVPFGLVMNVIVSAYAPGLVLQAIIITGIVTATMMMFGVMFPAFFQKIAGALTIALIVTIVVQLVSVLVFKQSYGILDWIVALIFCGYIGYDWGRANMIPKTFDNAVDSAAALYVDIINLFFRILRILGRR